LLEYFLKAKQVGENREKPWKVSQGVVKAKRPRPFKVCISDLKPFFAPFIFLVSNKAKSL
jgi:hypothetical protein